MKEHCEWLKGNCHNCHYEEEDGSCLIQKITGTYPDSWKGENKHEKEKMPENN